MKSLKERLKWTLVGLGLAVATVPIMLLGIVFLPVVIIIAGFFDPDSLRDACRKSFGKKEPQA